MIPMSFARLCDRADSVGNGLRHLNVFTLTSMGDEEAFVDGPLTSNSSHSD